MYPITSAHTCKTHESKEAGAIWHNNDRTHQASRRAKYDDNQTRNNQPNVGTTQTRDN